MNDFSSKSLSQRDVELGSFDSRNRVQVAPNIEANRPNRSVVSQAHADRICVIPNKMANPNRTVNVAPIVENGRPQPLFDDSQRETKFRIEYEELIAAHGDLQVHTGRGNGRIGAGGHSPLRACSIDGETAKRGLTAGEKALAGRDITAGK